jgi:putative oxidoreductase
MKILTIIARVLLGLMFVVFGLNGFLHFIHGEPSGEAAKNFATALASTGYFSVIFFFQLLGGALVLLGWVPLGLVILCPIIVNILLFHVFMAPEGLPMAVVVALLAAFLVWRYWENFAGIFKRRAA